MAGGSPKLYNFVLNQSSFSNLAKKIKLGHKGKDSKFVLRSVPASGENCGEHILTGFLIRDIFLFLVFNFYIFLHFLSKLFHSYFGKQGSRCWVISFSHNGVVGWLVKCLLFTSSSLANDF